MRITQRIRPPRATGDTDSSAGSPSHREGPQWLQVAPRPPLIHQATTPWRSVKVPLLGDVSGWRGRDRNLVWRRFTGQGSRVRHDAAQATAFEREIVADLRLAAAGYPDDPELTAMIADLHARSAAFAELWDRFEVGPKVSARKTVNHPETGPITLDCEVLAVAGSDLKIIVYTAEPDTPDAAALDLLRVIGVQRLAD